jgi:hypothetical protein
MKTLTWSLAILLLAVTSAHPEEPTSKGTLELIKKQEVERLRTTEAYYRRAGKVSSAEYYRQAAERAEKRYAPLPTIYVPVIKADGLSREEGLRLTEVLIKSIERESIYKVVATPEEADLIFEGTLRPAPRPKP